MSKVFERVVAVLAAILLAFSVVVGIQPAKAEKTMRNAARTATTPLRNLLIFVPFQKDVVCA